MNKTPLMNRMDDAFEDAFPCGYVVAMHVPGRYCIEVDAGRSGYEATELVEDVLRMDLGLVPHDMEWQYVGDHYDIHFSVDVPDACEECGGHGGRYIFDAATGGYDWHDCPVCHPRPDDEIPF